MFRRILTEDWQSTLTIVSFVLFLSVFSITALRAFIMPRRFVKHLESLPLQEDSGRG